MACPCEILIDTDDAVLGKEMLEIAKAEAFRIEKKFSRYIEGNIVHQINTSAGRPVKVDEETARLIDFADHCHRISNGLFDITSGILRKVWKFDGSDRVPKEEDVKTILPLVGWNKVKWRNPVIELAPGMEIDLGGIGKEYAVDRSLRALRDRYGVAVLVNYGGDIAMEGKRRDGKPWTVGIEDAEKEHVAVRIIEAKEGALATSGDSKKFLMINGKRYGHILDPRNGWPVSDAPRSVTVAANTCTEAGFLSTYGFLNGATADAFLESAGVRHWCY